LVIHDPDVVDGQWYFNAVAWATENNIVDRCGNGSFGKNDKITKEGHYTDCYADLICIDTTIYPRSLMYAAYRIYTVGTRRSWLRKPASLTDDLVHPPSRLA